jgi:hypothetical protein
MPEESAAKPALRFLDGYPPDQRTFFSPRDTIHPMLASLQLTIDRNAVIAAETRAILDLNHDWMLKQMAEEHEKTENRL